MRSGDVMACRAEGLFQRAPAVYWGISRESTLTLYRDDVPADIRRDVDAVLSNDAAALQRLAARLIARGLRLADIWAGPVFTFPDALPPFDEPVRVTPSDVGLLTAEFPEHARAIDRIQPCLAIVRDGRAVSVCCTARSGRCVDAGVDTARGFQRMGFGAAVCAEWARATRDLDRVPVYSTSWENTASRRLAARLHLIWIGIDAHFDLLSPGPP